MGKPYTKPALTFDQQLAQLEARGMRVGDRDFAINALGRISYYRLSAYWHPFKQPDRTFEPGTNFEEALKLYEFDRRLRLMVLDAIERVEVLVRTRVTYTLGHEYGAFAHTKASSFDSTFKHSDWYNELSKEIARAKETFLEHYGATYDGFPDVPIWMASEVMSLGTLSKMFKGMRHPDQSTVTSSWHVHRHVAQSWLHTLSYVRNVCAHHGRLWNRDLAIKPILPKHQPEWSTLHNRRVYSVLCILRRLTQPNPDGDGWAQEVVGLLTELNAIPRWQRAMGVPANWATQVFWKQPRAQ
jgi:abortive infection bacteriophage resistance protein